MSGENQSRDTPRRRELVVGKMTERHGWSHVSRALRRVLLALACVTASAISGGGSGLPGPSETLIHAPPATGPFAYNSFVPGLTVGASYVDPVFGSTVRRVTTDHGNDLIYARNMWWNADETRYFHSMAGKIINLVTNTVEYTGIPCGDFCFDAGFDPVDPNALYYFSGASLHKITLQAGGTWSDVVYWTTPDGALFKSLGGTINWLDASGRYMLVRYGAEPSVRLLVRQNLAAGPYANPIDGVGTVDRGSYVGLTPDGKFIVGFGNGGLYNLGRGLSWRIDHTNRTVPARPNEFWSLCGDHGSFISPSDGRDYMVIANCTTVPELWAVDITNNAAGLSDAQQRALPNNKRLLTWATWKDGIHVTTAAKGILKDWAFVSTEDGTDVFNGGVTPWHAYRQEIIAFNVITGEVRRLAHHRSRSVEANYFYTPRVSASWAGKWVGFASNFNQSRVNDIYVIPFTATSDTISPTVSSTSPSREGALPRGALGKGRGR